MALVASNTMQFGRIGLLGGIAAGVFSQFGIMLEWWVRSLIAVALVGILGYRQVDLSARVLIVLVALEYLIVFVVTLAILFSGGAEGLAVNIFDLQAFNSGSLTAAILFCLGSFIGIEATTIHGEEAGDPEKTIPRATYLAVLMIGVFFVFTTWLMIAGIGSVVQSIGALIVLAIFAGLGLDPILNMFTGISQIGTLGVIGMMCITSLSVIMFFRKTGIAASPVSTVVMPVIAGVIMAGLFVFIFADFGDLTGTTGGALGWILPSLIPLGAVIGVLLAERLKSADPAKFARMGQNQK
ncbi:MAG: hypothetical protein WAT25_09810 [Paracoccaceae bacterium]